jgi:excinuclease UvrABC nuclease subunit
MIPQLSIILNVSPLNILTDSKKSIISDNKAKEATGKSCVYKYVYNDEIIYIGKSDISLCARLNCHKTEVKFKPYIKESKIYYAELSNPAMSTIFETYLINKYKPILNVSMKYSGEVKIEIPEPEWELLKE